MIDEQPWLEHARHPGDHSNYMQRFDPRHHLKRFFKCVDHAVGFELPDVGPAAIEVPR